MGRARRRGCDLKIHSREDLERFRNRSDAALRRGAAARNALSQLRKVDPALAGRVHEISRIIGFRNILVHGYAIVDQPTVWRIVQEYLPALRAAVDTLLREAGEPDG